MNIDSIILPGPMEELAKLIKGRRPHRQISRIQSFFARYKYWTQKKTSTPSEMHAAGGGDCKSFAAAKYLILLRAGEPVSSLRIARMRLADDSYHDALQYGDVIVDRIRDIYTIPDVPATPHMSWNNEAIWGYWPFYGWADSPDPFGHLSGKMIGWRNLRSWNEMLGRLRYEALDPARI